MQIMHALSYIRHGFVQRLIQLLHRDFQILSLINSL